MKTFTGNNSLLRGSGLLLICLYLLYISQRCNQQPVTSVIPAETTITSSLPGGQDFENYFKSKLGEAFPVLKSLNLM